MIGPTVTTLRSESVSGAARRRKKVVICQYRLLHYRVQLFEELRAACDQAGIELSLVHGDPTPREATKRDVGNLSWATRTRNLSVSAGARDLLWQVAPALVRDADLVVLMQESRILSNYPVLASRGWMDRKVAYWGHGANFQTDRPNGLLEKWKRGLITKVDWWFAYTQATVDIVRAAGFPESRITCLNNAIDNDTFQRQLSEVTPAECDALRFELDIDAAAPIGLFCGSMYPDKRLEFLLESVNRIRERLPDFTAVFIGDGPSAEVVRTAAERHSWVKWLGVQTGKQKAVCFKMAAVVLNPGLVGLHILDSFCAGIPMVTTADAKHSPEIAYLKNGENGLIAAGTTHAYADAVVGLLADAGLRAKLSSNALASGESYTLGAMARNFLAGIQGCLFDERTQ